MPPGFWGDLVDTTEAMLFWGDSTDNVKPRDFIAYHLFLNGLFEDVTVGIDRHQFFLYLEPGIVNTIELFAVDEAGNSSEAATIKIDLR